MKRPSLLKFDNMQSLVNLPFLEASSLQAIKFLQRRLKAVGLLCSQLFLLSFFLLFLQLLPQPSFSAACCGGGFAAPAIIAGDDRAQVGATFTNSKISDDVFANGIWQKRYTPEVSRTLALDAAQIFDDLWQVGISGSVIERSRSDIRSNGVGDIAGTLAYEYLTDWDYQAYRPKGIGFIQLTMPTGTSTYDSSELHGLDVTGRGFWALGFGTLLTKSIGDWDFFLTTSIHRSFARRFHFSGQGDAWVRPGWGGGFTPGVGYNFGSWRLGTSINWQYESPVQVDGSGSDSSGVLQRYATAVISLGYLLSDGWSASLSYSDQRLFGQPLNTTLGQSLMIFGQHRWPR
jgi:hypothetical protein